MSCTNPSLLQVVELNKRLPRIAQCERLDKLGFKFNEDKTKAYRFAANNSKLIPLERLDEWQTYDLMELPCGSCLSCRMDYSKDWAIRCQFESKLHKHNYFVTLSYDDVHLCYGLKKNPTLVKQHIEEFIKTLRNFFYSKLSHKGIRYLLCGEYNSSGVRSVNPHYHLILFNCPIPDLTIDFPTPEGQIIHKLNRMKMPMFYSQIIASIWDKGYIAVDDANYNTEAYVSKYIMKKQKEDIPVYKGESQNLYTDALGIIPPFIRMSNRPGIGFNQFLINQDKYVIDPTIILEGSKKPVVSGLPKYFKRKLFEIKPQLRSKFEAYGKYQEFLNRTRRFAYQTTSNAQKAAKELHLQSVNQVFDRNNTN